MNLSQKEWSEKLNLSENAIIVDVRTPDECADGMIPSAINIDLYKGQGFIYEIDALDKSKEYFVYCKAGGRSEQACNIMQQLGFEHTFNLIGGFMQWTGTVV